MLQFFSLRSDEHIAHEERMVGTRADDADLDLVFLVPSCETVHNVNSISRVQVVNGTFAVDSPDLIKNNVSHC